jgi:hypothetical protein
MWGGGGPPADTLHMEVLRRPARWQLADRPPCWRGEGAGELGFTPLLLYGGEKRRGRAGEVRKFGRGEMHRLCYASPHSLSAAVSTVVFCKERED